MNKRINKTSMGLVAAGGVAAITVAIPLIAHAATDAGGVSATATAAPTTSPGAAGRLPQPRTQPPGGGETALSGTTATQVTKAALAAVPGASVVRVTTEHAGASNPYEAHLTKSDGSRVVVLIGSSFNVMSIQADPGAPPQPEAPLHEGA